MNHDPRLKTIEDYIHQDQRSLCASGSRYILLEGVAGSRKTDSMVRLGLRRHLVENKNILFLTQVGSVTDEICSRVATYLRTPVYRQAGSNHHLVQSQGKTIEVANFDAWVHRQLQDQEWKHLVSMGSYHAHKARSLEGLENFKGFCLKNGVYADEVLIDECQDFDPAKARLVVSLLRRVPHVRAVFCGDYMQTIFEKSLEEEDTHPLPIFASLGCERFYLQACFRCPAGHLAFCNRMLHKAVEKYGCKPLVAVDRDLGNKPFLFTHGSTTRKYDVHVLVAQLVQMVETLLSHEKDLKPSDFCFLMRKSNHQPVFDALRVALETMWSAHGHSNAVVHFQTQFDGYRNSIQWDHATGKSCLLSIHGDKGKGHRVVFFLGLTHRSIPDECAVHKEKELLYHSLVNVALTRSTQHLLVGFHYAQPSVYLTQMKPLEAHAYTGWGQNHHALWDRMAACSRFPRPDFDKPYRKTPLQIPTLNMISVVEVSRRFERPEDILGFHPRVDVVRFGSRVRARFPDDVYPVLSRMCELMLLKELHPDLFLQDLAWFPGEVVFTDDTRVLSWAQDFRLHKWAHTDMYQKQVGLLMDTYQSVIENDPPLRKVMEQVRARPVHVLHPCFHAPRFHKSVASFRENTETMASWWDLALLFHGVQDGGRLLRQEMDPARLAPLWKNVRSFQTLLQGNVVFRPCHDLLASVSDPSALTDLGFERELDDHYFLHGYYYGVLGTSGVMDTRSLYDLKVSPVDFSMEWFLQTSFHASMPTKKAQKPPEKLVVVNLMTGKMHRWDNTFPHPKKILKRLMSHYSFPEHLTDNLYRANHHRFRRHVRV